MNLMTTLTMNLLMTKLQKTLTMKVAMTKSQLQRRLLPRRKNLTKRCSSDDDDSEEEEEKMKVHQPTGSKRKADDADLNPPSKKSKDLDGKAAAVQAKTPERFQRIKAEEVTFKDDRLKDNRFESKGGAISSYGMKAHQDLIVTRGKGFTAEKNKKKRGSYRGGLIDQESYSVKFNYSDDE
ncbi:SRP40, C-terminal domain-containing protein [Chytriomyces cf. hyalinus JEL632]|nr:SRP40, C-terminal domain-containing protein [Chytriomyces cf. hyalinus JEL632]